MKDRRKQCSVPGSVFVWVLALSNLLVFQLSASYFNSNRQFDFISSTKEDLPSSPQSGNNGIVVGNALDFTGVAVPLPSVRVQENETGNVDDKRSFYGGKGDKPHLGGFANNAVDMDGVSPGMEAILLVAASL
jgi:hypothetical protein